MSNMPFELLALFFVLVSKRFTELFNIVYLLPYLFFVFFQVFILQFFKWFVELHGKRLFFFFLCIYCETYIYSFSIKTD